MHRRRYSIAKDTGLFFLLTIFWLIFSIVINDLPEIKNPTALISFLSISGVVQFFITIFSAKNRSHSWISLYIIFFAFLFLFNYGQFMMWAFGIHVNGEITMTSFVRFIDYTTCCKIMVTSMILFSAFHFGALIASSFKNRKAFSDPNILAQKKILKTIGIPVLIISSAINIGYTFIWFTAARGVGYVALFDISMPAVLKYLSYLFIPSLFLVLIAFDFSRKSFFILSFIFLVYAVPLLIAGDRSSWIYFIGPWFYAFIALVPRKGGKGLVTKKTRRKRVIFGLLFGILIIYIASIFTSIRDEGISNYDLSNFDFNNLFQAFIKPVFEMGSSSTLLGVLIQDNLNATWQYGNTYMSAILGMLFPSIRTFFGYQSFYIENWMSEYLNTGNYGVGFTAFAEAYLNGGALWSWFYIFLYGMMIGTIAPLKKLENYSINEKFIAFAGITVLLPTTRASMDLFLREFFWGVILILLLEGILMAKNKRENYSNTLKSVR